jgi:hypothetical protein
METLWSFAENFLASLPEQVTSGKMAECKELTRSWEGGPVLKRFILPRSKADVEVLEDFLGMLEERSQIQDVLNSSIEDYVDEAYCSPNIGLPPHLSYFN